MNYSKYKLLTHMILLALLALVGSQVAAKERIPTRSLIYVNKGSYEVASVKLTFQSDDKGRTIQSKPMALENKRNSSKHHFSLGEKQTIHLFDKTNKLDYANLGLRKGSFSDLKSLQMFLTVNIDGAAPKKCKSGNIDFYPDPNGKVVTFKTTGKTHYNNACKRILISN